ncbi:hypothetical protein R3P38DRAFT_3043398 [Favolaschia claudopus]|uniref:Glycosyltransferase n=1 Tax=Favolaschia claudopus TaxID=2862362 RepID=A0AAW0A773_9AGAR
MTPLVDSRKLKVAIITENFLPKVDGVTVTLAHLLEHSEAKEVRSILLGPSNMQTAEYAGCQLFRAFGVPLKFYPGLSANFFPPAFVQVLRDFQPDVIHLVDPIWLGIQALVIARILFPHIPLVTSHDTNLPAYATIFGFPYSRRRGWQILRYFHSFAKFTLVPSESTAKFLRRKGYANLRVCGRGADAEQFNRSVRTSIARESWGIGKDEVAVLSVGRLSPEKNLLVVIESISRLSAASKKRIVLIFVGQGPWDKYIRELCTSKKLRAIFLGQLSGGALGVAFANSDIMCNTSYTETFGQVTLEALFSGLPVVGLHAEGTADLITHWKNGLLLDVYAPEPWNPYAPLDSRTPVAYYDDCAPLMKPSSYAFGSLTARYATLLELLVTDPALRSRMADAAVSTAQQYTWDRCMDHILTSYIAASRCRIKPRRVFLNSGPARLMMDAFVVSFAILATALTHVLYMIPTFDDFADFMVEFLFDPDYFG